MWSTFDIIIHDLKELHQYVSDEDILYYYVGDFDNNSWVKSPFRPDEKAPSFRITYYNDDWVWTDFGRDTRPKKAIDFVKEFYNLNYYEAINKVYQDIYLNKDHKQLIKKVIKTENHSFCKIRSILTPGELEYWAPANITDKDLKYWKIYSGEIRNKGILWHRSTDKDPLFIYMWDKVKPIYKGYRPYAKETKGKFYANNVVGHIQGLEYLPDSGDILIITKSYKDVIVWWKLGYSAIAPHAETLFLSPFDIYDLQQRFKKIYVNYDNDETGVSKCIKFTTEYGLNYFNLPKSTGCKDPFELVIKYGYDELNNLLKEKIKRDENNNR
jgi:hypothetical protein